MPETQTEPCPACGSLLDVTGAQIFADRTCPVCGTPINVRRRFGHYELMSVVGSGGQGVVYRASDNNLNRLVALKLLRTEYSRDPTFISQFESEAQVTASINHPNVVRVFSFGTDEEHVYLAMELVDKGTMDDLMEKLGRVPEARALQIGVEIAQGLRAGFEQGLIHRDVKPGNILFGDDGTSKIVDFGLAMFFEQAAQEKGEIWGTPYYLSPERLNRAPEDFRSDIYSLGATLFHAIAGRPPFEAEDASHVALKHLRIQAVSLQTYAPGVCNSTAYVINRTLAKNPDERQQSYDEFIEQLQFAREEALTRARGGAKRQSKARVVLEDSESKKAMSWITLATLAVLVIGLIVGGLLVAKALRGGDGDTGNGRPVHGADSSPDKFGPGWPEARARLLGFEFSGAEDAYGALATKHEAGSPERAWAYVHQALAAQLGGRTGSAVSSLTNLESGGTQVSKFFSEQVLPHLRGRERTPAEVARGFNPRNFQVLGALFFARRNYELGHLDDAGALVRQFVAMSPDAAHGWLLEYRKLAKPMQDEFSTYSSAADPWTNARNARDRELALPALRNLPNQLPPNSKLQPKARELLGAAERKFAEDQAARSAANFAFHAKVTASGFDATKNEKPEQAVDGDLKTRWVAREQGEKWLALDLGQPREIGRWVVKTAGVSGENRDNNLTEARLQRSDDGRTWTEVDAVENNRSDILDRLVPPFKARHVRLVSTKPTVKGTDHALRVHEFELGSAAEQAKAEYSPGQNVALRFSPLLDFVAGPVGEPGATGSVRYDEKTKLFRIKGAGEDIWTANDHFHFVWQPVQGDCELVARVTKIEKKHEWTKAGVMIRSSLAKEASDGMVACGPDNKLQFLSRAEPSKETTGVIKTNLALPRWVKVMRAGNVVTGYESADGQTWNEVGRQTLVGLEPVAFVGLAVCSHVGGALAEAQFDNVTLTKK